MVGHIFTAFLAAAAARTVRLPEVEEGRTPMLVEAAGTLAMKPSPIEPSWIISGRPEARVASHSQGADGQAGACVWDCTAGTFRWHYGWDEWVFILEGEVEVTDETGAQRVLKAGDIGLFRAGTSATWRIENYVKKVAFCRRPFPAPVAWPFRLRQAMRGGAGGLAA